jgi:GDPmannose 4,6-dehydratase
MKKALITGINGQDGAYLAQLLLKKNYQVFGVYGNRNNKFENLRYLNIFEKIDLKFCDLRKFPETKKLLKSINPDEIYNLAAKSSVSKSFQNPLEVIQNNVSIAINVFQSVVELNLNSRIYQASSSEMFGQSESLPITGKEDFKPESPYAVSKVICHNLAIFYRSAYGLFISNGILFNHESYLRNEDYFLKKIIKQALKIKFDKQEHILVGNLSVKRDFGYAPKYVESMYLMMQQSNASDFIVCSGSPVSLREIVVYIFNKLEISMEKVRIDHKLFRPNEIEIIYGCNKDTKTRLGWTYDIGIHQLLDMLIEEEMSNFVRTI